MIKNLRYGQEVSGRELVRDFFRRHNITVTDEAESPLEDLIISEFEGIRGADELCSVLEAMMNHHRYGVAGKFISQKERALIVRLLRERLAQGRNYRSVFFRWMNQNRKRQNEVNYRNLYLVFEGVRKEIDPQMLLFSM